MRWARLISLVILTALVVGGCSPSPGPSGPAGRGPRPTETPESTTSPAKGLVFSLSEGTPGGGGTPTPPTESRPLSEAEVKKLIARLPAQKKIAGLKQEFALRESSLPAPRAGKVEKQPFPPPVPPEKAPEVESGPLKVLRHAPEGAVEQVPQLSVTFSQPMVAVTSHADTLAKGVPVRLAPEVEGNWRWVGTKTLLFEPRGLVSEGHELHRFPMATEYTVEVPAGTASATGNKLAAAERWTFKTPAPTLVGSAPNDGPHPLEPLFWLRFNQDVVPAKVLATVKVSRDVQVRQATEEEVKAANLTITEEEKKRWVVFKATAPLTPATSYTVSVGPGTPSAEGPLRTESAQDFSFRTYDRLRVEESRCGWGDDCRPLQPFFIRFNNPIDEEKFDPETMVRVEPKLPGLKVEANGSVIWVRGQTKGRTTYTVRLDGSLPDTFGQTLGESESLTFKVGSAQPQMMGMGGQLVTLQARDRPGYPLYLINYDKLKVRIHAVSAEDWPSFLKALSEQSYDRPFQSPGQKVVDITQDTGVQPDELTEVKIDLAPALKDGKGMAIVEVVPVTKEKYPPRIITWVQVTDLGLDAANDANSLVAYVSKLADGSPVAEAEVSLLGGPRGRAAADGSLKLELPSQSCEILVARSGQDTTFLPRNVYAWDRSGWSRVSQNDRLSWFVLDDRKMYRPDEEVLVKGWMRRWQAGPQGDIAGVEPGGQVNWILYDSRGNEVSKGQTEVSKLGGFDLKLKLPRTMNLGTSRLELSTGLSPGGGTTHTFEVQEFRRPEFEVSASAEPETSSIGQSALASVKASYYAGGGLPNAQVDWAVSASQGSFQPPGRDEYTFGTWTPWWDMDFYVRPMQEDVRTFEGRTDSSGVHRLKLDFASVEPPRPMVVRAEASVQDVNRQAWNASTSVLVHPSDVYVGLKTASTFVEQGKPIELDVLVCDTAGKALTGRPIELRSARIDYEYRKGRYQTVYADRQSFDEASKGDTPSHFSLKTPAGGTYQITVRTYDEKDRPNESQLTVWVPGGKQVPERGVTQEKVVLIPDRKDYQPGDTAQILVQAPFYPAEGVLTLRRSGLLETRRFSLAGPSTVLKVAVESAHIPNLYAQVDLVGKNKREDDASGKSERPAYATGKLNLSVPPRERTLKVEVLPAQKGLEPGAETHVDVRVIDAKGQNVADSEVALVMVDEAVLALTGYQIANPLDLFYAHRDTGVSDWHSRQYVLLVDLASLAEQSEVASRQRGVADEATMDGAPMPTVAAAPEAEMMSKAAAPSSQALEAGGGGAQPPPPPVKMRTNFSALALFAPRVRTKPDGTARVNVKLPDNLTRYRIVAVAVAGANQFGKGESSVVARLPLMVRPSPPRFLNFGDRAELPVVVQNQTDQPLEVQVVVRAQNAVLAEGQGKTFQVKANDRAEVRFPVSTDSAGTASFQVGAFSGKNSDASEFSFPVWTPATTEAFATYGQLDEGATAQPVQAPGEVWKQFGGLELTTTSTALAELTDAMIYLVTYSYGCAEQVSSRVLGIVALQDVLSAFRSEEMPDPEAVKKSVQLDLERLRGMQRSDGGFGFWRPDEEDWPYLSVHVAHTLVRAKLKGHAIPGDMLERSLAYVRDVENHIHHWYNLDCRRTIIAYALWVRFLNGDKDVGRAKKLVAEAGVDKLSLEALGFILPILSKEPEAATIRRHLDNRVTETAEAANFVQDYGESGPHLLFYSDRRVDAILLEALILDSPKSDLIPKLVRGLLGHRTKGRWLNTQENVFVLLAMDRYFNTYEKVTPDFVARVWLGKQYAGEQRFQGRSPDRKGLEVPMTWLAGKGKQDLVLSKEGRGRLYYRIGMRYAPKDLKLDPADHGFTVQRRYEAVDDKGDVTQDAEGVWMVKAGARVRVRLTMVAPNRRYHVALVDPLPAGLEPLNPALKVTGTVPQDPKQRDAIGPYWYWMGTWYEHQNMRDERVEAFTSLLWEGVYDYTYVARATTPGDYVVPPSKAEEMYNPETFGRSGSDRLVVR